MAGGNKNPQGIGKTVSDFGDFLGSVGYAAGQPMPWVQPTMNFAQSVGNFVSSNPQATSGQGWGDIQANQQRRDAAAMFPKQYQGVLDANAKKNAALFANAANNTLTNWGKGAVAAPPKGGAKNPPKTIPGTITPSTIAGSMKQVLGPQAAAEKARAEQLGQLYGAGQAAGTADKEYQAQVDAQRNAAIDSNLSAAYSPLQALLEQQKAAASKRYAQNEANVTSIFGALSGLTAEDSARINKQFTDSIAKQQTDYAARVAEQKTAATAGTAQAAATGAERGAGPAMNTSPVQTAADASNAGAQAAMTNWQGLMQSEQNQAVKDAETRGTGYTQQKLGALAQLSRNFEDTMAQFADKSANLQSQMAQAKIDAKNAYAANDFAAAQNADKQSAALQLQDLKNQGLMGVAQLKARVALARGTGGTKAPSLKGIDAVMSTAANLGVDFNAIQNSVQDAYNSALQSHNKGTTKNAAPTVQEVKTAWYQLNGGSPQSRTKNTPVATGIIENLYK